MKTLIDYANEYAKQSTWKDFAVVKLCLCAAGVMIGLSIPEKKKKLCFGAAWFVFLATYLPLMDRFFRIIQKDCKKG